MNYGIVEKYREILLGVYKVLFFGCWGEREGEMFLCYGICLVGYLY